MSNSIKVDTRTKVTIDNKDAIVVVPTTNTPINTNVNSKVTVSPRSYHIVSPDVYTIKRNSTLEPWFEDQINSIIDNGDLADDVSDLDSRFGNFQDGVTLEIGYLRTADEELAYNLGVLKVSNDTNTAGISNLH